MRAEDLVFWLDALGDDGGTAPGVLCLRHADSMVVPRHWTLDDLRDPDLHLFRPPAPLPAPLPAPRRRNHPTGSASEQLLLLTDQAPADGADLTVGTNVVVAEADSDPAVPWTPTFDDDDDLGGLLAARSPLLARAFRGDDRPRTS